MVDIVLFLVLCMHILDFSENDNRDITRYLSFIDSIVPDIDDGVNKFDQKYMYSYTILDAIFNNNLNGQTQFQTLDYLQQHSKEFLEYFQQKYKYIITNKSIKWSFYLVSEIRKILNEHAETRRLIGIFDKFITKLFPDVINSANYVEQCPLKDQNNLINFNLYRNNSNILMFSLKNIIDNAPKTTRPLFVCTSSFVDKKYYLSTLALLDDDPPIQLTIIKVPIGTPIVYIGKITDTKSYQYEIILPNGHFEEAILSDEIEELKKEASAANCQELIESNVAADLDVATFKFGYFKADVKNIFSELYELFRR